MYLQFVESLEGGLPLEHGGGGGEGERVDLGVRPRDGERVLLQLRVGAALAASGGAQRRRRRRRLQALRVLQKHIILCINMSHDPAD